MENTVEIVKFLVVPFLFMAIVVLIFTLIVKRIWFEYITPIQESVNGIVDNFLIEMVLTMPSREAFKTQLQHLKKNIPLKKDWCKEAIIDQMISFKSNIHGNGAEQINVLYKALKLDKFSRKFLHDRRACIKCQGFYHFQALNYKKGIPDIQPFLKHKEIVTRSGATMAYISLTENYMESFLEFKTDITSLTVVLLMDIIHVKKISIPHNIDRWLDTRFNSMTKLGLRIMVYYNYNQRSKEIIALTKHKLDDIKIEAIVAIRFLFLDEAKEDLIKLFSQVNDQVQLEIIKTLQAIGDKSIIPFLLNIIQSRTNKDIKLEAVCCLNAIDVETVDNIAINDVQVQLMLKHVREIYLL